MGSPVLLERNRLASGAALSLVLAGRTLAASLPYPANSDAIGEYADVTAAEAGTRVDTPVRIVNQPHTAAWADRRPFAEVQPPLEANENGVFEPDPTAFARWIANASAAMRARAVSVGRVAYRSP